MRALTGFPAAFGDRRAGRRAAGRAHQPARHGGRARPAALRAFLSLVARIRFWHAAADRRHGRGRLLLRRDHALTRHDRARGRPRPARSARCSASSPPASISAASSRRWFSAPSWTTAARAWCSSRCRLQPGRDGDGGDAVAPAGLSEPLRTCQIGRFAPCLGLRRPDILPPSAAAPWGIVQR